MVICIICNTPIPSGAPGAQQRKTCSNKCRIQHRTNRALKRKEKRLIEIQCKICGTTFIRDSKRIQGGFCSRSCASKHYVSIGTYDSWINHKNPKTGENIPCLICGKLFYIKPFLVNSKDRPKTCSKKCNNEYLSKLFSGQGNPMFGVHPTKEQKTKKLETLLTKYNITNAYQLSSRSIISKPQHELFAFIKQIVPTAELEKLVKSTPYYADILLENEKKIIEFNGDYWHCNPKIYNEFYFHKVKNKSAKEIWKEDELRKDILKQNGYSILYIWEEEYKTQQELVLTKIKEFLK